MSTKTDGAADEPIAPLKVVQPVSHRPRHRAWRVMRWLLLFFVLEAAAVWLIEHQAPGSVPVATPTPKASPSTGSAPQAGDFVKQDSLEYLDADQAAKLIRADYPAGVPVTGVGITKIIFHYRSSLPGGQLITVYGRAYLPDTPRTNLPIFAFAPGTTGIGDQCAASLEKPAVANWANYDSHLSAYATQGYAAVTTDYEGMRDPGRLHHYMVGELEGRALLDAVRALRQLPQATGRLAGWARRFLG
jgi:hypothetical protein